MLNAPTLPPLDEHRRPALLLVERAEAATGVGGPGTAFVCRNDGFCLAELPLADIFSALALAPVLNVPLQVTGIDPETERMLRGLAPAMRCVIYDPSPDVERTAQ